VKSFQAQTFYELLEVSVGASDVDIRAAYERLSRLYAEDQVALYGLIDEGRARALRSRLKEAVDVLLDEDRRASYDATIGLPPREVPKKKAAVAVERPAAPTSWAGSFAFVSATAAAPTPATISYSYTVSTGSASFARPSAPERPVVAVAIPAPVQARAPHVEESKALPVEVKPAPVEVKPAPVEEPKPAPPEAKPAPVDEPKPAPVEAKSPPVEEPKPAPVEEPKPAPAEEPVEEPKAAPVEAKPPPVEEQKAAPLEAKPAPVEEAKPPPVEEPRPAPAEDTKPTPVDAKPTPVEEPKPPPVEESKPVEDKPAPVEAKPKPVDEPKPVEPPQEPPMDPDGESAIVPTRPFTPKEYRPPERPRPYEVPAGVEFNGDLLRQVRMARGLSLLQLSERTRIGVRHLENLEGDRYDQLPAMVYLRGMLMSVARELGLDGLRVSKSYLTFVEAHQAKAKG
jgi:curved DNA-binding protein CbpA